MSISINEKTNYSTLFNSLSSGSSTSNGLNGINLADYASIKNGSYGKLMKAYYAKNTSEDNDEESTTDKASSLNKVAATADSVKEAADKLITKGSNSIFAQKDITTTDEDGNTTTSKGYDTDAIYKAVKSFADSYNSFINKAKKSSESTVANRADSLANMMTVNYASLKSVGIEINDDDSLKIDEETFKKADMNTVKNLFNGNQSLAYQVSAQASMIGTSAATAANSASGYTSTGTYNSSYSAGSMINDIV